MLEVRPGHVLRENKEPQTRTRPPGKAAHVQPHPKGRSAAWNKGKDGGLGLMMTTHSCITQSIRRGMMRGEELDAASDIASGSVS